MNEVVSLSSITIATPVPLFMLAGLGIAALILILIAVARGTTGAILRLGALLLLLLAAADLHVIDREERPLPDRALVIVDESISQRLGDRAERTEAALADLLDTLEAQPQLEVTVERVRQSAEDQTEGTQLFAALDRMAADLPDGQLAGVVLLTDGQVHDAPGPDDRDRIEALRRLNAPVHALITGQRGERDRQVRVTRAPSYGIVGQSVNIEVTVTETPDFGQTVPVVMNRDYAETVSRTITTGETAIFEIPIEHAGQNLIEFETPLIEGELSARNNKGAILINGVRDRLRVLLVSGKPHNGGRDWRNLLKADPSVDLVHFTILRSLDTVDFTPLNELALIAFPKQELFEEKLDQFDLIVMDRFSRQGLLPRHHLRNIADYVENGGAILMAVGPEYTGAVSLYATPMRDVLPGVPTGQAYTGPVQPVLSETGTLHPVTRSLTDGETGPIGGRWLRQVFIEPMSAGSVGHVLMTGREDRPLLLASRMGEGRIAMMLSDTTWLWSKGFDGGGPKAELTRRLVHWLMKEPELEEETLLAKVDGQTLNIRRQSLEPEPTVFTVVKPDGSEVEIEAVPDARGQMTASMPLDVLGLYRVSDGDLSAAAVAGSPNPLELSNLVATGDRLAPAVGSTGGQTLWLSETGTPEIRRIRPDRASAGRDWIGLLENRNSAVIGLRESPMVPLAYLISGAALLLLASWFREWK